MEGLFGMEQRSRFERDQLSCLLLEDFGGRRTEAEQDPVGPSWYKKTFWVPCFSSAKKRLQPPRPSLSTKRQIQTVVKQGTEGTGKQRKSSQETIVQQ